MIIMESPDSSKWRGKCVIILIIDTGLLIFDGARTAYLIILEIVSSATVAGSGRHSKLLHSHQLSSLLKHNNTNTNTNYTKNNSSPITATNNNNSNILTSAITTNPSILASNNVKTLINSVSSTMASSLIDEAAATNKSIPADISSSGASQIIQDFSYEHQIREQSDTDKLIIGFLVSILIIIIQIWAVSTLWKACQPEIHPRLGGKCCRKYCNYTLFPRTPLILFKWAIPGLIFILGENTVVCIFSMCYCLVCYHWVSEYGKELIEITMNSSTVLGTARSSNATTTTLWQNNIAFPNLIINPDGPSDHAIVATPSPSATVTTMDVSGVGGVSSILNNGLGGGGPGGDDDEDTLYRRPQHEIPKHERIGFRI